MAKEKKYFWLRLKRDFFKRHDIQIVEGMPNGKDYILFYLKLLCESVDHEGNLRFSDEIPYNEQMLSTLTNTNIDIVRTAIEVFTRLGMMEIMDDGTYYMNGVEKMIGCMEQDEHTRESTRLRVQAYRERQKQKALEENKTLPKRYSNVTCNGEIELEIEKDINNNILSGNPTENPVSEIIDYLNQATGKNYKATTDKTKKCIHARLKEGFTVDDFKTVIDIKCKKWLKDDKMRDFLRPETLFGTKFEGYLNEAPQKKPVVEQPVEIQPQEEPLDIRTDYLSYPKDTWTEDEIEDAVDKGIITEEEAHQILWG